jgi:hypothetical protein
MQIKYIALTLTLFFPTFQALAESNKLSVISKSIVGTYVDDPSKENHLFPSEVVRVLKRYRSYVVIERVDEQPSFEIKSDRENRSAKSPTRIPNSNIVGPADFIKLNSWRGETRFIACAGSCDAGTVYDFSVDGSFTAHYDENSDSPKRRSWNGHLFKQGKIYWARPKGSDGKIEKNSIFYMKDDGTLCTPVECFGNVQ